MAYSTVGYAGPYPPFPQYARSDAGADDGSKQLPASQLTMRLSRGSNGQRAGNTMRVTKPSSTSNSPRSAMQPGRRRTLVNDGWRRQQIIDQVFLPLAETESFPSPTKRMPRPVSWHPGPSHYQVQHQIQQQQQKQQQPQPPQQPSTYYVPATQGTYHDRELFTNYPHMSPLPSSYSCQTSPVTFSPLSLPSNDFSLQPYLPTGSQGWGLPSQHMPNYVSPGKETCIVSPAVESHLDYNETYPPLFPNAAPTPPSTASNGTHFIHAQSSSIADWRSFVQHGFDGTSPPTPENLPQVRQVKTAVKSEEGEDEGEVLVGMGLYDHPDKTGADPGLNNYRSTLPSLLGGGGSRQQEPNGRGLMLEETWQPPESDDEEEDEDGENEEAD